MIRELARTAYASGAVLALTGVMCPAVIAMSFKDEETADPLIRWWGRGVLKAAGVRVRLEGLEHLPERTCVYVSNHQSHFDAPLIFANIPRHVRFIAKAELFKIPIFGRAMAASGNVKVDRTGGEHDRGAMDTAAQAVRERTNVLFFAEGTRSEDGTLLPFKKGAAGLALAAGVPLVPMAIAGTRDILPKGTTLIQGDRTAALCVGAPVSQEGIGPEDRDALTERVRAEVARLHARARVLCGA